MNDAELLEVIQKLEIAVHQIHQVERAVMGGQPIEAEWLRSILDQLDKIKRFLKKKESR